MIDQERQIQLRKKFNPEGSPLRQHQLKMLSILIEIDKVCKENGIRYWLSSGSYLGAIRHNGFIPWDDDVDIEMMRPDYNRFIEVFNETDELVLQTCSNDKYYYSPFGKVRDKKTVVYDSLYKYKGVFIDVFSLEYSSRFMSILSSFLHKAMLDRLYRILKRFRTNRFLFTVLSSCFVLNKFFFFSMCVPVFRFLDKLFPFRKLRHTYGVGWSENVRNENEIFPLAYASFEGLVLPVPNEWDLYLTKLYDDYMRVPEENELPSKHVQCLK